MTDRARHLRPHHVDPIAPEVAGYAPQPNASVQVATLCRIEQTINQTMGEVRDELERVATAIDANTATVRDVVKRLRESDERMEAVLQGSTRNLREVGQLVRAFRRVTYTSAIAQGLLMFAALAAIYGLRA